MLMFLVVGGTQGQNYCTRTRLGKTQNRLSGLCLHPSSATLQDGVFIV